MLVPIRSWLRPTTSALRRSGVVDMHPPGARPQALALTGASHQTQFPLERQALSSPQSLATRWPRTCRGKARGKQGESRGKPLPLLSPCFPPAFPLLTEPEPGACASWVAKLGSELGFSRLEGWERMRWHSDAVKPATHCGGSRKAMLYKGFRVRAVGACRAEVKRASPVRTACISHVACVSIWKIYA